MPVVLLFAQLLLFSAVARASCQPFNTSFSTPSSVADPQHKNLSASFVAVSPENSYQVGKSGLELLLRRPVGIVTTDGSVNDKLGTGATINSSFTLLHGKVTFMIAAPAVPGIVTAVILLSNATDEVDIEILGGDARHWQTNMFAPPSGNPNDSAVQPMYNVFSSVESVANHTDITQIHSYSIDWTSDHIDWGIDGQVVRTLKKVNTQKNGVFYFPSHPARIQMGIWDASSPLGTAQWARGPVNWTEAPTLLNATVKSVTVECP